MAISKQQRMAPLASRKQTNSQTKCEDMNNIIERSLQILNDDFETSAADEHDVSDSSRAFSQSAGPQRSISFAVAIKVVEVMSLEDYSDKELRRCWYSLEEKEKMNHSKDKIVARLEAGKKPRSDMTYRGLECWTTLGGQALDENIARSVNAVMDEQDRQWAHNCDDWNMIAECSAAATVDSAEIARDIAIRDQKEARLAWESSDDLCSASQHSAMSESVALEAPAGKQLFDVLMKRCSSSKAKRRHAPIEEPSAPSQEVQSPSSDDKEKRRKSKEGKKSKKSSKKSRRSCGDPPAPVKRSASQEASELLLRMVSAGRQMNQLTV